MSIISLVVADAKESDNLLHLFTCIGLLNKQVKINESVITKVHLPLYTEDFSSLSSIRLNYLKDRMEHFHNSIEALLWPMNIDGNIKPCTTMFILKEPWQTYKENSLVLEKRMDAMTCYFIQPDIQLSLPKFKIFRSEKAMRCFCLKLINVSKTSCFELDIAENLVVGLLQRIYGYGVCGINAIRYALYFPLVIERVLPAYLDIEMKIKLESIIEEFDISYSDKVSGEYMLQLFLKLNRWIEKYYLESAKDFAQSDLIDCINIILINLLLYQEYILLKMDMERKDALFETGELKRYAINYGKLIEKLIVGIFKQNASYTRKYHFFEKNISTSDPNVYIQSELQRIIGIKNMLLYDLQKFQIISRDVQFVRFMKNFPVASQ